MKFSKFVLIVSAALATQIIKAQDPDPKKAEPAKPVALRAAVLCEELSKGKVTTLPFAAAIPSVTAEDAQQFYGREQNGNKKTLEQIRLGHSLEEGTENIRYRIVSAEDEEAVEVTVQVKGDKVLTYEVNLSCGKAFGFGKTSAASSNIAPEILEKIQDLMGAEDEARQYDELARVEGSEEFDERGPGGGKPGGGGGGSRPPSSSGGGSRPPSGGGGSKPPSSGGSSGSSRPGGSSGGSSSGWTTGKSTNPYKPSTPITPPKGSTPVTPPKGSTPSTPVTPPKGSTPSTPVTPPKGGTGGTTPSTPVTPPKGGTGGTTSPGAPSKLPTPLSSKGSTDPKNVGGRVDDHGKYSIEYNKGGDKLKVTTADGKKTTHFDEKTGKISRIEKHAGVDEKGKANIHSTEFDGKGGSTVKINNKTVYTQSAPTVINNKTIVNRNYITNDNRTISRSYHTHVSGGFTYYSYVPGYHYNPWYYTWSFPGPGIYHPWYGSPYVYQPSWWFWYERPWYTPYSYYFVPYRTYSSPFLWLTDYYLGRSIQVSYEQEESRRRDAEYQRGYNEGVKNGSRLVNNEQVAINEETKKQLAAQAAEIVKLQQKNQAKEKPELGDSLPVPEILKDTKRIFPIEEDVEVTVLDKATLQPTDKLCSLTSGDMIQLVVPMTETDQLGRAVVINAKRGNCPPQTRISISKTNLSQMLNSFGEKVLEGGEAMQKDKNIKFDTK